MCTRSIFFTIYSSKNNCPSNLGSTDNMEVYIRLLSNPSEWIPVAFIQINGQRDNARRHGYDIPYGYVLRPSNSAMDFIHGHITVCNFSLTDSIQVRWLVTSRTTKTHRAPRDVWSLDDVEITLITECDNYTLLADSFDMSELK